VIKIKEDQGRMVNIGTSERPVLVSRKALEPDTPEGREWWEMVASGSVTLEEKELGKLLSVTDEKKN
jgi:hypothetical protein